ncbi:MAG: S24/S26 family peptidase [Clostridia bacterium]|jgi:signal peptidase I
MDQTNLYKALTEIQLRQNNNRITVKGVSMEPIISSGDQVVLEKAESYRIGDIVTAFDQKGRLLTHRIVRMKKDMWYIKGDHAVAVESVDPKDCFGRVVTIIRDDGTEQKVSYGLKSILIVFLSLKMHKRFLVVKNTEQVFKGRYYKWICMLSKHRIK